MRIPLDESKKIVDINSFKTKWDKIGIGISGFCAIHCLFFPIAIALLPLWPVTEYIHEWTHPILFILIAPTVFFAVRNQPSFGTIPLILYMGMLIVGLAWVLHDLTGIWGEAIVTLCGSSLLVIGHWKNYIHHKKREKQIYETP